MCVCDAEMSFIAIIVLPRYGSPNSQRWKLVLGRMQAQAFTNWFILDLNFNDSDIYYSFLFTTIQIIIAVEGLLPQPVHRIEPICIQFNKYHSIDGGNAHGQTLMSNYINCMIIKSIGQTGAGTHTAVCITNLPSNFARTKSKVNKLQKHFKWHCYCCSSMRHRIIVDSTSDSDNQCILWLKVKVYRIQFLFFLALLAVVFAWISISMLRISMIGLCEASRHDFQFSWYDFKWCTDVSHTFMFMRLIPTETIWCTDTIHCFTKFARRHIHIQSPA